MFGRRRLQKLVSSAFLNRRLRVSEKSMAARQPLLVFRLVPGQDLFDSITTKCNENGAGSHIVLTCVGSLKNCRIRLAGAKPNAQNIVDLPGPFEVVSLTGTVAQGRSHMHISVADVTGKVVGGHLMPGSLVDTTAEVSLIDCMSVGGLKLVRTDQTQSGFPELNVEKA